MHRAYEAPTDQHQTFVVELKVVKIVSGSETDCTEGDDFSLINLPANSIFRQVELLVNGTSVADTYTSNYHYKAYLETQLRYYYF